jgi:LacI family transcriptional regulator
MSSVSQKKLSETLGVTQAAVSKALSNAPDISPELRAKIRAKARELGYRPNKLARSLAGGRADIAGIFMPPAAENMSKFYGSVLYGLDMALRKNGYVPLVLCSSGNDREDEKNLNFLFQYKIAGVIAVAAALSPGVSDYFSRLLKDGGAAVSVGQTGIPGMPYSAGRDGESVMEMVRYLTDAGHRKIVFAGVARTSEEKRDAFLAAVKEFDLPARDNYPVNFEDGKALDAGLSALMGSGSRSTAILAGHDWLALRIISALDRLGIRVPDDVSVTGFGDEANFPEYIKVPLTTIRHDIQDLADGAFGLLLKKIKNEPCPLECLSKNYLVERLSVKKI